MRAFDRRSFLSTSAAGLALATTLPSVAQQQGSSSPTSSSSGNLNLPPPSERKGETVELKGAKIFYGKEGQGSPMLLIHGYPLSGALFSRIVPTLAQAHTVITPDLRGYGKSHAPGVSSSVDVYAEDMLELMDKLGFKKATIGGMSMGGPVALTMYKKAPERFDGLVLIDTNFKKANPAEAGLWRGVATMVEKTGNEMLVPYLLPQMLTGKTRMNDKGEVAYLKEIIKPASTDALVSGAKALEDREDATELLARIDVPTLVVVGEDDPIYGFEISKMMHEKIKGSKLHIVPGAAHAAVFEQPDDAGGAIADWAKSVRS